MQLFFWLHGFPRTITRREWQEIWRWKRITVKNVASQNASKIEMLHEQNIPDYIKRDIMYDITFPPLLIHDKQRMSPDAPAPTP